MLLPWTLFQPPLHPGCVIFTSRSKQGHAVADVRVSRQSRKHLPYSCGPPSVGSRSGGAEVLRSKSIGAAPPLLTANLAKPGFVPHAGPFSVPLTGDQAAHRLSCKFVAAVTLRKRAPDTPFGYARCSSKSRPPPPRTLITLFPKSESFLFWA